MVAGSIEGGTEHRGRDNELIVSSFETRGVVDEPTAGVRLEDWLRRDYKKSLKYFSEQFFSTRPPAKGLKCDLRFLQMYKAGHQIGG
jgi:hypothetical protein